MPNATVEIIGGGLSGLALGIGLRLRDVPVHLIEVQAYPRHRLCGEFLHGGGEQVLARLGLEPPRSAPQHREVLWSDARGPIIQHALPQPVRGWSRHALDAALAQRLRELGGHIEIRRALAEELIPAPGRVLACGRRRQPSPWFGLKLHLRDFKLQAGLEMHLGRNGYLGLTEVEDGWVNACGLFRTQNLGPVPAAERLPAILEAGGLSSLGERLRTATLRAGSICAVAGLRLGNQRRLHSNHSLSLGDARCCPAPLSGSGQSMALQASELVAPWLAQWSQGKLSWPEAQRASQQALARAQHRPARLGLALNQLALHPLGQWALIALGRRGWLPMKTLAQRLVAEDRHPQRPLLPAMFRDSN